LYSERGMMNCDYYDMSRMDTRCKGCFGVYTSDTLRAIGYFEERGVLNIIHFYN
jgi:hypothetical protein